MILLLLLLLAQDGGERPTGQPVGSLGVAIPRVPVVAIGTAGQAPKRLRSVIRAFLVVSGYPGGRPGFVVDHLVPLCAGGADGVSNLQWQERQASYRKDVYERQLCREMARQGLRMIPR